MQEILRQIADEDVAGLAKAQESYGDSWCKRGGVGAFMMAARKWDRLELQVSKQPGANPMHAMLTNPDRYDIFAHIATDPRSEGVIDDIRDLRRYLMLIEARARLLQLQGAKTQHRDNT